MQCNSSLALRQGYFYSKVLSFWPCSSSATLFLFWQHGSVLANIQILSQLTFHTFYIWQFSCRLGNFLRGPCITNCCNPVSFLPLLKYQLECVQEIQKHEMSMFILLNRWKVEKWVGQISIISRMWRLERLSHPYIVGWKNILARYVSEIQW